mgnify:CR=1 FL=1|jgi:hypothetical protein
MKRIISLLIVVFASSILVACNNKLKDNSLSVVFYTGPGATDVPTVFDLEVGEKVPLPDEPTSVAGTFSAWYKEIECINKWDFENDTLSKGITLYAKWDYFSFSISYNLRGGEWPEDLANGIYPTTYTYLTEFHFSTRAADFPKYPRNDPENPYKGLFLGWWKEPDLTAAQRKDIPKTESITKGTTGDIVLYAYYSRDI